MDETDKKEKVPPLQAVIYTGPRNYSRQDYCRKPSCKNASKSASQKKWLNKPENKNCFKGPDNVERVREWRKDNPDYWKRSNPQTALQDPLIVQGTENTADNDQKKCNCVTKPLIGATPCYHRINI